MEIKYCIVLYNRHLIQDSGEVLTQYIWKFIKITLNTFAQFTCRIFGQPPFMYVYPPPVFFHTIYQLIGCNVALARAGGGGWYSIVVQNRRALKGANTCIFLFQSISKLHYPWQQRERGAQCSKFQNEKKIKILSDFILIRLISQYTLPNLYPNC